MKSARIDPPRLHPPDRASHPRWAVLGLCLGALLLAGCERAMRNMYQQPKEKTLAQSDFFPDGQSARPLSSGTVARSGGALAGTSSGRRGELPLPVHAGTVTPVLAFGGTGAPSVRNPLPMSAAMLERGRQRFNIYCAPCHSEVGDGDGMVARRGFPHPPTYHSDRLRNAPDEHFFDVITRGYGAMYPYADRVTPDDRWAIVAYIRALQLSQHATLANVPPGEAKALQQAKR